MEPTDAITPEANRRAHDEQWVDQRIQEALNASVRPLQEQLAVLTELLSRSQLAASPPGNLRVPASEEETGVRTPVSITAPTPPTLRTKPLPNPSKFSGKRREYTA